MYPRAELLKVLVRWLLLSMGSLILLLVLAWCCLRQYASHRAFVKDSVANGSGKCLLITCVRNYSDLGIAGRVVSVFSSTHFYRIYDGTGNLLATSEWNFREHQVGPFAAEWLGRTGMYPTRHGWAGFTLNECSADSAQTLHD